MYPLVRVVVPPRQNPVAPVIALGSVASPVRVMVKAVAVAVVHGLLPVTVGVSVTVTAVALLASCVLNV